MTRYDLLSCMDAVDEGVLARSEGEQAAAPRRTARSARLFSPLAAVLAALLLLTVAAAALVLGPKLAVTKRGNDSFVLSLEGGQAAKDAPGFLAQYYLPTQLPESSLLTHGEIDCGTHFVWKLSSAAGEGQISFSQRPLAQGSELRAIAETDGLNPDQLNQETRELDGTQYWTLTGKSSLGEFGWYYWKDPTSHYLFSAFFTEAVPQEARASFLRSVRPADQAELCELMGVSGETVWSLGYLPEHYVLERFSLSASGDGMVVQSKAADSQGHEILLQQNFTGDDLDHLDKSERLLDGSSVSVFTARAEVDGAVWSQETWRWFPGEGKPELRLSFFDTGRGGSPLSDEEKLAVYRGLRQDPAEQLALGEICRPEK